MTAVESEVRPGAYYDSIVLMRLQAALAKLPGVLDAGVVMATEANLALLAAGGLLPSSAGGLAADDLLVVVKAQSAVVAEDALGQIDPLLAQRRAAGDDTYRPRSLATAVKQLPEAAWVLVSVPGRHAAGIAREALELGRHVFLYSDNVSLADEVELKRTAREKGLLVMGPDCGTAIVGGLGLGFANRVRRGAVGLVGASGTGLQAISSRVHELGGGISHALGTGGRDLSEEVGAATAHQALELLGRDDATRVIVLVSKPPSRAVTTRLLAAARATGKPVVVHFIGHPPPARCLGSLRFAGGLGDAAALAMELLEGDPATPSPATASAPYLRGLFAGGTLAYEALQGLAVWLEPLCSNIAAAGVEPLADLATSRAHTVLDLGEDAFTVGRPHPMIDQDLRLRRLRQEAADPEVGAVLLDVVLGDGAHPDPAAELAPAIARARAGRELEIVAVVVGTDEDPQDLGAQIEALEQAGAVVFRDVADAVAHVGRCLPAAPREALPAVDPAALTAPAAINVGLESFYDSLIEQGASAVHVDWRPPAGGDERLLAILSKMRT